MKKIIFLILFAFVSFSNAQDKQTNKLLLKEKYINKNILKNNEENHQTFSFGGGFLYVGGDSINFLPAISFSSTFQFSYNFLLEIKYDYCPGTLHKSDTYHTHIYSLILQTCFNLYDKKWKLYTGIGMGLASVNKFGFYFPTGNTKIEYNINRWSSVNTECMLFPVWSSANNESVGVPVMIKLNLNFKLPY